MAFTGEMAGAKRPPEEAQEHYERMTMGLDPIGEGDMYDDELLNGPPVRSKEAADDEELLDDSEVASGEMLPNEHATPYTQPWQFGPDDAPINQANMGIVPSIGDPDPQSPGENYNHELQTADDDEEEDRE